jgi:hypothetical protein
MNPASGVRFLTVNGLLNNSRFLAANKSTSLKPGDDRFQTLKKDLIGPHIGNQRRDSHEFLARGGAALQRGTLLHGMTPIRFLGESLVQAVNR